ncbi:uncharacterized protein AMSG_01712 [Thecamonas trahens ATCC 50062]|uniref:Uncharacterized protein n=1 Tax=Thecamonas trahens ATCC 50062 TaxID=461836 RepID=A0A0L0DTQ2_THETB|nr:hypothetical protein AMSG_01712 [Thecamonas trahens ATCC 50062]KNC54858.1 hypothetical protein AMSG_01712 [Thecamonas trahens ATCC 50062]|eukprot:XP_013761755.1 hypothetical protein AMSG_01712 [Thecamonas trahens ATCC 50062]
MEELTLKKAELKAQIRRLKEEGAEPERIAPVFEEYKAVSAALKEKEAAAGAAAAAAAATVAAPSAIGGAAAGAASGAAATPARGADQGAMSREDAEARKSFLKGEIKRGKAEGWDPARVKVLYDEYVALKSGLESGQFEAGGSRPAGEAAAGTAAVLRAGPGFTLDEVVMLKDEAKRRVKDIKTSAPSDTEALREVYELYTALKADIEAYPQISDAAGRMKALMGGKGANDGRASAGTRKVAVAPEAPTPMAAPTTTQPAVSAGEAARLGEQMWAAAKKGDAILVQELIEAGAEVNTTMENGASGLVVAALRGHYGVAKVLTAAGADVEAQAQGASPLYCAVQNGHVEVAKVLLNGGASPNSVNTTAAVTPLWMAAYMGDTEMVKILLDAGADVHVAKPQGGITPLSIAVERGKLKCVEQLIAAGADVEARDADGFTCLCVASQHQNLAIVDALIGAGADLNATTASGDAPIDIAATCGFAHTVDRLIDAGVPFRNNKNVQELDRLRDLQ